MPRFRLALPILAGMAFAGAGSAEEPAPVDVPPSLILSLSMDKPVYRLGDAAYAEVSLENASGTTVSVLDLVLEARSLSIEYETAGAPPFVYTVTRPNVFFGDRAGPLRVALQPGKRLVSVIPLAMIRPGKTSLTAVYRGATPDARPIRTQGVPVDVQAGNAATLIARIETVVAEPQSRTGTLVVQLTPEATPVHVINFIVLARQGFYDGLPFFRVLPDFVIQTGCPRGSGIGDPGYNIPNEHHPDQKHTRGAVVMNHHRNRPDSAGSQFFICLKDAPAQDMPGEKYTVFGRVTDGMDVADALASVETDPKTNRPVKPVAIAKLSIETR